MATNRVLQLLRSNKVYVPDAQTNKTAKEVAKAAVQALPGRKDGEMLLARYQETGADIKSLLCVYHASPSLPDGTTAGWTFIEDAQSGADGIKALQTELDKLEGQVGLDGTQNTYTPSVSGDAAQVLTGAQSEGTAPTNLKTAVENIATYVGGLDADVNYTTVDDSKIISGVNQVNGQVNATKAELSSIKVASVTGSNAKIAEEDALGTALGKLQAQIDAMDSNVTIAVNSGDVITSISETYGVVTANKANLTDVLMTGYEADSTKTGAIAATDTLEQAFNKLENSVSAVGVDSPNKTINVTNNGRSVDVNIDGVTLVADSTSGEISTNLKIVEVVPTGSTLGTDQIEGTLGTNVEKAYVLYDGTNIHGKQIDIYKDSAVKAVKLSTEDATWDSTNNVIADGSGADALALAYTLSDGRVDVVTINVADFLRESEFRDGLTVDSGVVKVKAGKGLTFGTADASDQNRKPLEVQIDTASESFLTVSASGVKLSGVQDAIDKAINALDNTDSAVTGQVVTAVSTADGKASPTKANLAGVQLGGFTQDATASGTIADTDTLGGALNKLENAIDSVASAAAAAHTVVHGAQGNTHVTVTASKPDATTGAITYTVNESDIASAQGLADEITRAQSAETAIDDAVGLTKAANDEGRTYASQVTLGTNETAPTTVAGDIDLLDAHVEALNSAALKGVTAGNNGITVGTAANNSQSVSLNVSEKSDNVLDILTTSGEQGLYLSNVWDCGTY